MRLDIHLCKSKRHSRAICESNTIPNIWWLWMMLWKQDTTRAFEVKRESTPETVSRRICNLLIKRSNTWWWFCISKIQHMYERWNDYVCTPKAVSEIAYSWFQKDEKCKQLAPKTNEVLMFALEDRRLKLKMITCKVFIVKCVSHIAGFKI